MYNPTQLIFLFIIIFTVLFLLLSLFIVFIIYRYKQKQNAHHQALQSIAVAHENALLQAQLEVQEQTFINISREIHDNVGQKLALVKLQLISVQHNHSIELNETIDTIGNAITDLRDISRTMSADTILANGFVPAIEFEVQQLNKTALFNTSFEVKGDAVFLEGKRELVLFRIVQEALQNVVKHANATEVKILVDFNPENMIVSIADNGQGFDPSAYNGQGLKNMQARAKMIDGKCEIWSSEQEGTELKIIVPLMVVEEMDN
jgi:signal transduction histidine kinase